MGINRKYYVYVLLDDRHPGEYDNPYLKLDFKPFYVGKGTARINNDREIRHLFHYRSYKFKSQFDKNPHKCRTIKILLEDLKFQPNYQIIFQSDDEQEVCNVETELIDYWKPFNKCGILTNIARGGKGGNTIDTVPGLKDKLIKIASERWTGKGNPKFGIPLEQNHSHLSKMSGKHWNEGNKYDWSQDTLDKVNENRKQYINKIVKVDLITREDLEIGLSIDLIKKYNLNKTALNRSLNYGGKHSGFLWRY